MFFGALLGRSICGFLCPVGLLQEFVHKIPFVKKIKNWKGDKPLRYLKYAVLALFVVILPLAMTLTPAFCKYICPGGTLSALLLAAADKSIRPLLGALFRWKLAVLLILLLLCLSIWRPFCKYLCPLGAFYGFFNRVSLHRLRLDVSRCVHCGKCESACPMCVYPAENPASMECIRCGECVNVCPVDALSLGWGGQTEKSAPCVKRGR